MRAIRQMLFYVLVGIVLLGASGARANLVTGTLNYDHGGWSLLNVPVDTTGLWAMSLTPTNGTNYVGSYGIADPEKGTTRDLFWIVTGTTGDTIYLSTTGFEAVAGTGLYNATGWATPTHHYVHWWQNSDQWGTVEATGTNAPFTTSPTISNDGGASDVADVSATLNGDLVSVGNSATAVSVYWGAVDQGTNAIGWDHVANFGQCLVGAVSTNVAGLTQGATYYYRFYASNAVGMAWAGPAAQFKTASAPAIDNGSGATSITPLSARLTGNLTSGGNASVTVYWGTTDGGMTTSSWQHTNSVGSLNEGAFLSDINGLSPSTTYYYRCYAVNVAGSAWAGSAASFQTSPTLANGSAFGMKITFTGYNKAETLTNFPVLVVFGPNIANFAYSQLQSPNGWDLRFTTSNQVTALNHEIDQWNTNGNSYVWVQVPTISSSNDYIWAYWGNPAAAGQPAACTTNGSTWDQTFVSVWHLNNTNAIGNLADSTSAHCDGTNNATTSVPGEIGSARYFNGSSAYINCGDRTNYNTMANAVTVEMWFNGSAGEMVSRNPAGWGSFDIRLIGSVPQFSLLTDFFSCPAITFGQWYHLTVTVDHNTTTVRMYLNGTKCVDYTSEPARPPTSGILYLGSALGGSLWSGALDEMRFSSVVRSSNWIWACYMNQASNSLFNSYQIQSGSTSTAATVHGIPYSWLQSYGITNTSDSVETQHVAGSSLNVLQDYIAGLNPTNPNSRFCAGITNVAGQIIVRVPSIQATGSNYAGKSRYYDVELRTNLLLGSWQLVPNYTNIPGDGSVITFTNAGQNQAAFYRSKVWLQ